MTDEAQFLHGTELAERVRYVCAEDKVDCAVAFLGPNMKADMFPRPSQVLRIVCDIAMGCTSKRALLGFGAPANLEAIGNPNLRVHNWLHSKVYISAAGAVIGSPNLSSKALGSGGVRPTNLEAGTYHQADSKVFDAVKTWFDDLFAASSQVTWADVEKASDYANDPGQNYDAAALDNVPLLRRIRTKPEAFQGLSFVVTSEDLSSKTEKTLIEAEQREGVNSLSVIAWNEEAEWTDIEKAVVAFHRDDNGGRTVDGYAGCHPAAKQDCLLLFGVKGWGRLRKLYPEVGLKKPFTASEWQIVGSLWNGEQTVFSAIEFADALNAAAHASGQA